jgi:hypothetical protein
VYTRFVITAALLVALSPGLGAQAGPKSWRLQLKAYPTLEQGKATLVEGTATPDGDRFFVEHLSIIQPVAVTVITRDPGDDVTLALSKFRFDEADRTASTGGSGKAQIKLRTQGEMKIVVTAAKPTKYQLAVWAGPEVKPVPPPVVLTPKQIAERGGAGSSRSTMFWAGGIGLVVVGLIAAVATRRRRK